MKHFGILQKTTFWQPPKCLVRTNPMFILSFFSQQHNTQRELPLGEFLSPRVSWWRRAHQDCPSSPTPVPLRPVGTAEWHPKVTHPCWFYRQGWSSSFHTLGHFPACCGNRFLASKESILAALRSSQGCWIISNFKGRDAGWTESSPAVNAALVELFGEGRS